MKNLIKEKLNSFVKKENDEPKIEIEENFEIERSRRSKVKNIC